MEELLKIAYRNFLDTNDESTSKGIRIINQATAEIDEELDALRKVLSNELFDEAWDKISGGVAEVQEAAFIAGFACCAKFLTNGKTDLLPND